MGIDIGFKCKNCGAIENFAIGVGCFLGLYMNPCIDTLVEHVGKKEAAYLLYLQERRGAKMVCFPNYRLYECQRCETVHSRMHYEIIYDEGKKYSKVYHCDTCEKELRPLPDDIDIHAFDPSAYRCKECGQKTLENTGVTLFWD